MARTAIKVDRALLEKCLAEVEKDGPLKTRTELWKQTAAAYNEVSDEEISFSVVSLRVAEWGLEVKTSSARGKGRKMSKAHKEALAAGRSGGRKSKAEKFKESSVARESLTILRTKVPERFQSVVDQVESGSRTAAVKLHCLECSAFQTSEVRKCGISSCSLYLFRPYQGKLEADEDVDDGDDGDDCDEEFAA